MSHVYDTVQGVRDDLNLVLFEREAVIDNAILALLTKQNHLQVGSPGIAKSLLVDALHCRILGAKRFKVDCAQDTTKDEILGPQDFLALADHGKKCRVHARSIVEADLAFFEEIGRANTLAYSVMIQTLGEEREVDELGMDAVIHMPLISAFAASNSHLIGDKSLEALNNRFLLRDEVAPVQTRASRLRLLTSPPKPKTDIGATMTLDDLRQSQQESQTVRGNAEVAGAVLDLQDVLRAEGVLITDRLLTWSGPLLKAHAWLHGADELSLEDLSVLAGAWWQDPKEKQTVQRAIYAVSNPLDLRALEVEDNAMDLLKSLPHEDDPAFVQVGENVNVQLQDMLTSLIREIKRSRARDKRKALASLQRVHAAHATFAVAYARRTNMGHIDISSVLAGV